MELDLCGLKCPLPVMRTRVALKDLAEEGELIVLCTDPLAVIDIPHLLEELGHELISQTQMPDHVRFVIRKQNVVLEGNNKQ